MFDRVRREREEFERALALSDGVRDWTAYRNISEAYADSVYGEQTVPLSFRYAVWLQSQVAGDAPVIKVPRNATGDEHFAVMLNELLLRVWMESGSQREWKQAIFDVCGFGSTCVWYGFHADVIDLETAEGASESPSDTIQRALAGDVDALPGQDRQMAIAGIQSVMQDEVSRIAMPMGAHDALANAAINQLELLKKERKDPSNPSVEKRKIWARRLSIGHDVRWSHDVADLRDVRWMARRVVMSLEEAKKFDGFTPHARGNIVPSKFGPMDGIEPVESREGEGLEDENSRFVFWEVWDKEYACRHYISEQMDEFLEVDETYPYVNKTTGEPAIPGFFPCVVSAPLKHAMNKPERTTGIPLIEAGYPIQREITKLHNFAMASVKRHSVRCYEVSDSLDDEAIADLTEGVDGAFIRRPAGVEPGGMVLPIQFTGEAYRIVELIARLEAQWSAMVGMPLADLTSQPQAGTATAEQISVSAGRNQADHVIRSLEEDMARAAEIIRSMLSIGLYPPEKIAAIMGPGYEDLMAAWQSSSLEGDAIVLKSASRAKADQAVRIKQLGDALQLTMGYADPKTGLPVYDASPIIEEILMALDVGRPRRIAWTQDDLMLRMGMAGGAAGAQGPSESSRAEGPTTAGNEAAAARNVRT